MLLTFVTIKKNKATKLKPEADMKEAVRRDFEGLNYLFSKVSPIISFIA
jgi:hypothetical protein